MSLALCPQVVFQASQHCRSPETQATGEGQFAHPVYLLSHSPWLWRAQDSTSTVVSWTLKALSHTNDRLPGILVFDFLHLSLPYCWLQTAAVKPLILANSDTSVPSSTHSSQHSYTQPHWSPLHITALLPAWRSTGRRSLKGQPLEHALQSCRATSVVFSDACCNLKWAGHHLQSLQLTSILTRLWNQTEYKRYLKGSRQQTTATSLQQSPFVDSDTEGFELNWLLPPSDR